MTTPKQTLVKHLVTVPHGIPTHPRMRATLTQLEEMHADAHKRHLAHTLTGEQITISLAPPKNPSSNRNGDRNWRLNVAYRGHGWYWEMAGTRPGDSEGAKKAANAILGWDPTWTAQGWGYTVKETTS
jgi:hypothetical protein